MKKQKKIESTILSAAQKVFLEKGYDGAKMADIASLAEIDTTLLYYYFRSKENLFYLVFDEAFSLLRERITLSIISDEQNIQIKIRNIIREYISFFKTNPYLPLFVINEFSRNPSETRRKIGFIISNERTLQIFSEQLQKEYEKGTVRHISALHLVLDIISLCIFPVMCKPIINEINKNCLGEIQFDLQDKEIEDFIMNAIKL